MAFELPPLPYAYEALDAYIDTQTMHLHHDAHHAAYVKNLNAALEKHSDWQTRGIEEILRNINSVPEAVRTAVRNNGGGHANHSMFWRIMKPNGGGAPTGKIAEALGHLGSFDSFKERFNEAGTKLFGSGWVWLVRTGAGQLEIITTPNQDSPFMQGHYPILGNDCWEHAYYLKYNNRRPEYLKAWWNTVNWEEINKRLEESLRMKVAA